jgi:hypothetical protein
MPVTPEQSAAAEKAAVKFVFAWINLFLASFFAMFVVGGLHDHADPRVPDLGYWGAFFTVWALSLGGHLIRKGLLQEDTNGE